MHCSGGKRVPAAPREGIHPTTFEEGVKVVARVGGEARLSTAVLSTRSRW